MFYAWKASRAAFTRAIREFYTAALPAKTKGRSRSA
jgi:hypothetical protein